MIVNYLKWTQNNIACDVITQKYYHKDRFCFHNYLQLVDKFKFNIFEYRLTG